VGWGTYRRAFLSVLIVGLAAFCGEWIVHQLEYLIEYGSRFGTVMAASPHRLYMTPLGVALLAVALAAFGLVALVLGANSVRSRRLLRVLPEGVQRFLPHGPLSVPAASVLATAGLLAAYQTLIYFVQENLESVLAGYGRPGLLVLLSPQHSTLLPLQSLVALCSSLILWTAFALLRRSGDVLDAVRSLVRLFLRAEERRVERPVVCGRIPNLRLVAGILGLRSPPLAL
jgi:hypothetical protein